MLPKSACCDKHQDRPAVAKFRYTLKGVEKLERVCLTCGDVWWRTYEGKKEVLWTLRIEELTRQDLEGVN